MPARAKRGGPLDGHRRKRRINTKKSKRNFPKIIFIVLFTLVFFLLISLRTRFWNTSGKLALVVNQEENILVYIFDKELKEITEITIPGSTEVVVSRQLGTWKIGSVWKLGVNEKLDGKLLAETLTRHFKLPVFAWADKEAQGFIEGGPLSLIKAVIFPYKTNLLIGDRLKIGIFAASVSEFNREEIDFRESSFLKKVTLVDGGEGYILSGQIPTNITSLFSDSQLVTQEVKVAIIDATGSYGIGEGFGEIIEVMGGKIVAIKDEQAKDIDCEIYSKDNSLSLKLARAFSCHISQEKKEGNFDLVFELGLKFWRRF